MSKRHSEWLPGEVKPGPYPDESGRVPGEVKLPQPGELHNASSVPVSDVALAALLSLAQQGMALANCQVEDCENCNAHRLIWWDCCNALDRSTRIALQSWLNAEGYGLPEAPWEDADQQGNPSPRDYVGPRA